MPRRLRTGRAARQEGGEWLAAPVGEGQEGSLSATVLVGYTLEAATCGLLKASTHRVVAPTGDTGGRVSVAYRQRARPQALLEPCVIARGERPPSPHPTSSCVLPAHSALGRYLRAFDQHAKK